MRKKLLNKKTATESDLMSWIGLIIGDKKTRRQVCGVTHTKNDDVTIWYYPEWKPKSNIYIQTLRTCTGREIIKRGFRILSESSHYNYVPAYEQE